MMPSSKADRIVFDLDDTLYLERDFAISGFRAVGLWLNRDDFAARCQELFDGGCRGDIFDRALQGSGLSAPVEALVRVYRDHVPQIALCPDASRYLRVHGARVGLITDGPERMQRTKIAVLGLEAYCDAIIPTGQWQGNFGKPHPRAFEMIAGQAAGRRCVYVADNPAKDFITPNRMGWITVQILRPLRVHRGDPPDAAHAARHRIDSLDHLDGLLVAGRD